MTVNDHRKIMFQNYYELVDFAKELLFFVDSFFSLNMQRKKDLVVLYEAIPDPSKTKEHYELFLKKVTRNC